MNHSHEHPSAPTALKAAAIGVRYTFPMHPEIVRDAPGSCPKCGMTLVPTPESVSSHALAQG